MLRGFYQAYTYFNLHTWDFEQYAPTTGKSKFSVACLFNII